MPWGDPTAPFEESVCQWCGTRIYLVRVSINNWEWVTGLKRPRVTWQCHADAEWPAARLHQPVLLAGTRTAHPRNRSRRAPVRRDLAQRNRRLVFRPSRAAGSGGLVIRGGSTLFKLVRCLLREAVRKSRWYLPQGFPDLLSGEEIIEKGNNIRALEFYRRCSANRRYFY